MKQTQNQFYGKAIDLPRLPKGSTYLATDTGKLYVYGDNENPILSSASGEEGGEITWTEITGKPSLFDGNYDNLTNQPTIFDGAYVNLTGKPTLFDGVYNSLSSKPTLFDGAYGSLSGTPTLFDEDYNSLTNKPTLFDGAYGSLSGTPSLFSGNWADLSGAPAVDTTDDAAFDRLLINRVETSTAGPQYAIKGINNSNLSGAYNIGLYGQSDHTGGNTSNFNYGSFNKGRFSGTNGMAGGVYGSFNEAEYRGSDPGGNNGAFGIVYATQSMADITSAASGTINFVIGNKVDVQQLSSSVVLGEVYGQFTKVNLAAGTTTGSVSVNNLAYEGSAAIGGSQFNMLKIQSGVTPTMSNGGFAYAINSESSLLSRFWGRVYVQVLSNESTVEPFIYASQNVVRQEGTGGATQVYAATFESEQTGSGPIDFLGGPISRVEAKGNGTSLIDYVRGADIQSKLNSAGTTVNHMQGLHTTVNLTAGTANDVYIHLLDFDKSGGTIDNNFAYIKIQNDTVGTVGGTARAISSSSTLPSVFDGSIETTSIIKTGAASTDFLKGDGTIDSNTYLTDVKASDNADAADASNVGTMRYRTSGNNSFADMSMQTGTSTFAWVNIVENNY